MDMSAIIIIWVVILVIQNVLEKKKPTSNPPPNRSENDSPDFEIPTLANDPNFPNEENQIYIPSQTQSAEVREINLEEIYRQKKFSAETEAEKIFPKLQTELPKVEQKNFSLDLTPSATMNAIILGEILSKPKFKR